MAFVPETYHTYLLQKKARRIRSETGDDRWKAEKERISNKPTRAVLDSCQRPFKLLIFEPMIIPESTYLFKFRSDLTFLRIVLMSMRAVSNPSWDFVFVLWNIPNHFQECS